ncbi:hypothetical protein HWV62_11007 [Athelia sp. TMB]|nr:hypothetical protein HWV62_11007 [Athelia sp. TMB]
MLARLKRAFYVLHLPLFICPAIATKSITWTSPTADDVYAPGDTIVGTWQGISPAGIRLCLVGGERDCGAYVSPAMQVSTRDGSYLALLKIPEVTLDAPYAFYLQMQPVHKHGDEHTEMSPIFSLHPTAKNAHASATPAGAPSAPAVNQIYQSASSQATPSQSTVPSQSTTSSQYTAPSQSIILSPISSASPPFTSHPTSAPTSESSYTSSDSFLAAAPTAHLPVIGLNHTPRSNALSGPLLKATIAIPIALVFAILLVGGIVLALLRKSNKSGVGKARGKGRIASDGASWAQKQMAKADAQAILYGEKDEPHGHEALGFPLPATATPPPARTTQSQGTLRRAADVQASVHRDFLMSRSMRGAPPLPNPFSDPILGDADIAPVGAQVRKGSARSLTASTFDSADSAAEGRKGLAGAFIDSVSSFASASLSSVEANQTSSGLTPARKRRIRVPKGSQSIAPRPRTSRESGDLIDSRQPSASTEDAD